MALPRLFAHFGVAVQPCQPGTAGEHGVGLHQHRLVQVVEAPDNLAAQLDVRNLILAHRHQIGLTEGDVGGLAHRIAQKSVGQVVIAVVFWPSVLMVGLWRRVLTLTSME